MGEGGGKVMGWVSDWFGIRIEMVWGTIGGNGVRKGEL